MQEVAWKPPKPGALVRHPSKKFARDLNDNWFRGLKPGRPKILFASVTLTMVHNQPYNTHISTAYFSGCECEKYRLVPFMLYRQEIARARNQAVMTAIKGDFTYICFMDDDSHMIENAIGKLVDRMKEFNACSGSYYIRGFPFHPMVFRWTDETRTKMKLPDPYDYEKYIDADGVMRDEVAALGCGITMFRVADFKRVPFPWFMTGPYHTEDVYWFHKAHTHLKSPYKVGMDFNIDVGHQLEPLVVRHSNVKILREAYGKLHGPWKDRG